MTPKHSMAITPLRRTTPSEALTVVSPYGSAAASTRVRLYHWLDHLGLSATNFSTPVSPALGPVSWRGTPGESWRPKGVSGISVAAPIRSSSCPVKRRQSATAIEKKLMVNAEHSVYDFDDALFADSEGWRAVLVKADKRRISASAADTVIAGDEFPAEWASSYARDVRLIPSCISPDDYLPKTTRGIATKPRLVWLGRTQPKNISTSLRWPCAN